MRENQPQIEINFDLVKKRAVKGVAALTGRTFLLQIIAFFGFFLLTVFLGKEEIGLFFAVSELVAILGYFSDIGLAAALIQKKEKISLKDIRSTFAIQEGIVLFLVSLAVILTPFITRFYTISPAGIWLFRSLIVGFFLASLKTIPSVILERRLRFDILVLVEIAETLIFYLLAVVLAWKGFGVTSYAWAVLIRGLVGVILIYLFSPWKIGLAFKIDSLKQLLHFGLPYQANTVLAVIKDRMMNIFLWKIIGASGVGILGWAQKWAQMPLRFIMDPVMKVTFPTFSRIQENQERLKRAVEFSLFLVAALSFPLILGLVILSRPLILLIPRYQKWEVALIPLYLFCFNSIWGAVTTPLTNAFNAVGKIKITFRLMILWTALTWLLTPILAIKYGFIGASWALGLVPISSVLVFYLAKKNLGIVVSRGIKEPALASLAMTIFLFGWQKIFSLDKIILLILAIVSASLVYLLILFILAREKFDQGRRLIKNAFSI